jgi:hypothetical protein
MSPEKNGSAIKDFPDSLPLSNIFDILHWLGERVKGIFFFPSDSKYYSLE